MASDSAARTNPSELALPVKSVTSQPRATMNAASPMNEIVWPPQSSRKSRLRNATRVPARFVTSRGYRREVAQTAVLKAVIFDVDFTIAQPGPDLGPEGYRRLGERYGLTLDPSRYDEARRAAFTTLKRHPELDHDEEIWVLFTQRIIEGMGGEGDTYRAAVEMERAWAISHHFELYDDALPTLAAVRERGLKIGLLSNTERDLDA